MAESVIASMRSVLGLSEGECRQYLALYPDSPDLAVLTALEALAISGPPPASPQTTQDAHDSRPDSPPPSVSSPPRASAPPSPGITPESPVPSLISSSPSASRTSSICEEPLSPFSSPPRQPQARPHVAECLEARREILAQQDEAYQASLAVDRARRQMELERAAAVEEQRKREAAFEKQRLQELEDRRGWAVGLAAGRLKATPEPPTHGAINPTTTVRFRLPGGNNVVTRRFFLGDAVQVLVDYAVCQTRREEVELKVLLCWPRRDLVTGPRTASLQEAGLGRQETITVEVVEEEE